MGDEKKVEAVKAATVADDGKTLPVMPEGESVHELPKARQVRVLVGKQNQPGVVIRLERYSPTGADGLAQAVKGNGATCYVVRMEVAHDMVGTYLADEIKRY